MAYVIRIHCTAILVYDAQKTGSTTLKLHYENCKTKPGVADTCTKSCTCAVL
jgi:hypothetical protein